MRCLIVPHCHENGSHDFENPCNPMCRIAVRHFEWKGHEYEVAMRDCNSPCFGNSFSVYEFVNEILRSDDDLYGSCETIDCDLFESSFQKITCNIPGGVRIVKDLWSEISKVSIVTGIGRSVRTSIRSDDACAATRSDECINAAKAAIRSERQWRKARAVFEEAKKLINSRYRGAYRSHSEELQPEGSLQH